MPLQAWYQFIGDMSNSGVGDCDLTVTTTPTFSDGLFGKALSSGGSAYWTADQTAKVLNNSAVSFAFWVYVDAPTGDTDKRAMFFGTNNMGEGNNRKFSIFQYPSCNDLHLSWQNNTASTTYINGVWTGVLPSYKWTHVCITYNNPTAKLYINGKNIWTSSGVSNSSTFAYQTNVIYQCAYRKLTDYRIYNHCLSPKEVKLLSQGLVCHYKLGDIGGCPNLYTGSHDFSGTWGNSASWTTDTETFNGFVVKKRTGTYAGLYQNIPATINDVFTISFYAKRESGANVMSIHRSSLGNVTTGLSILGGNFETGTTWLAAGSSNLDWKYCWATVQITSADITYLQWRIENSVANKAMWITHLKVERGDKATPWIPNSADSEYTIMGYDESTVYDCSGYNYHGETMTTTMTCSSDTPRNLISTHFNGTYDGVIINNLPLSGIINSAVTYSFWIKPESEADARSVYFGSYSGTSWSIEKSTANVLRLYWNGSPDEHCAGVTITDGEWQHICITKNGTSDVKVYINGVQKWTSTATHSALTFPTTYRIGRDTRSNDGTPYKGLMSDFRIYATALSADDILELYQVGASIDKDGNLYAYELKEE